MANMTRPANAWIALTDDWELRGNGLGDVGVLQAAPANSLMTLYEQLRVTGTFMVEVLQQLAFEREQHKSVSLRRQSDLWRWTVSSMVARGFDVQLHVHPQWLGATYEDGYWKLGTRWHLADYSADEVAEMVSSAYEYLRELVPSDSVCCFRAGAFGMGPPSGHVLDALTGIGITVDVSISEGIHFAGENISLDYRVLESPYEPYYPDHDDIRRCASEPGPIVEVPTQSVQAEQVPDKRLEARLRTVPWVAAIAHRIRRRSDPFPVLPAHVATDPFGYASGRALHAPLICDLSSTMPTERLIRVLDTCIERALSSARELSFLVMENHTKVLQSPADFERIRRCLSHVRSRWGDSIAFVSLRTMAENIQLVRPRIGGGRADT